MTRRTVGYGLLPLEARESLDPAVTGGKGASLARLRQADFDVPDALLVPAAAYDAWFEAQSIEVPDELHAMDDAGLAIFCAELRQRLERSPIPAATIVAMHRPLEALLLGGSVAVRSSPTLEDRTGAAFAGQHDTFLGLSTARGAIDAIHRCWLSLWHDHAVRQRLESGLDVRQVSMAVIVQRMVAADVSGVAFMLDPVSGRTDRITINAARGLGESNVAGDTDNDQWHVKKGSKEVIASHTGRQRHAVVQGIDGTRRVTLGCRERDTPSLDAEGIASIAELAERAESVFGYPQDLEWVILGGKPWLLQSRA